MRQLSKGYCHGAASGTRRLLRLFHLTHNLLHGIYIGVVLKQVGENAVARLRLPAAGDTHFSAFGNIGTAFRALVHGQHPFYVAAFAAVYIIMLFYDVSHVKSRTKAMASYNYKKRS